MAISNLEQYLAAWNLSDPQPLAQTVSSNVYTVTYEGERVVLKLLTPTGIEERAGALALRYWNGRGAVYLLRSDDHAHLVEYAAGDDLKSMVINGEDERATHVIAGVLNQLHSVTDPIPTTGITLLKPWFRSLFKKAALDQAAGLDTIYVRAGRLAEQLLSEPRDIRVLHGDIHHENIRYKEGRGWLAFDPKGLVGERTYDAANTLCNPTGMPELVRNEARLLRNAAILADVMDIELSRVLLFIYMYVCLSASWYVEDGEHPDHELAIAAIVEPHLRL